ncbi:MAG: two-component system response regulator CreB [Methylophilaceae bacterium]
MPLHILIVEDEPAIAETLIYACKEANMTTMHKLFGQQALAELGKNHFDLVILDIGLPDMTGFEVCKQIRAKSNVPVLFLTARNNEIDRIVGLEIGADDYVVKPFSPREVVARIKAILRRGEAKNMAGKPALSPFLLDEEASSIQYHHTLLSLTRYEYLLLKTLILKPKRVFSRSQLMDFVWQDAEDTLERTVDAHIKTLRAKLRAINENEIIITHRGMGYSLALT